MIMPAKAVITANTKISSALIEHEIAFFTG